MSKTSKKRGIRKPLRHLLEGDFLSRKSVVSNLPYIAFLGVLGLIYIANTYYVEKNFKEIEATKKELKELRYQYITTKSHLMFLSKQSEVAQRAAAMGLKETQIPPYKIYYTPKNEE